MSRRRVRSSSGGRRELTVLPVLVALGALGTVVASSHALPPGLALLPAAAAAACSGGASRTASPLLVIAHGAVLSLATLVALVALSVHAPDGGVAEDRVLRGGARNMTAGEKLRIGAKIAAAKLAGAPRPFFVQYSLLNGCNAKCVYCNCPEREDRTRHPISTSRPRRVRRLGAVRIKFLGGEPLLCIRRRHARRRRRGASGCAPPSSRTVSSIPSRIDPVRAARRAHHLDRRQRSGPRPQRGEGTWKKVMAAIEAARTAKLDFFLTAVVTRERRRRRLAHRDRATVRRDPSISRSRSPTRRCTVPDAQQWMPSPDEIRTLAAKITAAKKPARRSSFHRAPTATRSVGRLRERARRPAGGASPCTAGHYFLQLEPNGDVYPVVLQIGTFHAEERVRDGVEAAWRHAPRHSVLRLLQHVAQRESRNLRPAAGDPDELLANYLLAAGRLR